LLSTASHPSLKLPTWLEAGEALRTESDNYQERSHIFLWC